MRERGRWRERREKEGEEREGKRDGKRKGWADRETVRMAYEIEFSTAAELGRRHSPSIAVGV